MALGAEDAVAGLGAAGFGRGKRAFQRRIAGAEDLTVGVREAQGRKREETREREPDGTRSNSVSPKPSHDETNIPPMGL